MTSSPAVSPLEPAKDADRPFRGCDTETGRLLQVGDDDTLEHYCAAEQQPHLSVQGFEVSISYPTPDAELTRRRPPRNSAARLFAPPLLPKVQYHKHLSPDLETPMPDTTQSQNSGGACQSGPGRPPVLGTRFRIDPEPKEDRSLPPRIPASVRSTFVIPRTGTESPKQRNRIPTTPFPLVVSNCRV